MKQNKNARGQPIPSQPKAVSLYFKTTQCSHIFQNAAKVPQKMNKRLANSQIPMQN